MALLVARLLILMLMQIDHGVFLFFDDLHQNHNIPNVPILPNMMISTHRNPKTIFLYILDYDAA